MPKGQHHFGVIPFGWRFYPFLLNLRHSPFAPPIAVAVRSFSLARPLFLRVLDSAINRTIAKGKNIWTRLRERTVVSLCGITQPSPFFAHLCPRKATSVFSGFSLWTSAHGFHHFSLTNRSGWRYFWLALVAVATLGLIACIAYYFYYVFRYEISH